MSDQWGQPQQPQDPYSYGGGQQPSGPQGPSYNQPQGPYGQQPPNPYYGQPVQQPQGPYGQPPQPGPYGPAQPQGPYGQPPQPITPQNPYGMPQAPYGDPAQGQYPGPGMPGQQPYGYPQPGQGNAGKKNQNMIISGAVVVVLIVASVIFFVAKGSGSGSHSGGSNASATGTSVSAGSGTQAQAAGCAAWNSEEGTMNNQNPNSESDMVSMLGQDVPQMQTIAGDAQAGTFKTEMQKVAADFDSLETYLQANPNLDTSTSTPPAQFAAIDESILTDISSLNTTCGLPLPDATDTGGSGF